MTSHLLLNDFNNSEYDQKMRQNQDIGDFSEAIGKPAIGLGQKKTPAE